MAKYIKTEEGYKTRQELDIERESYDLVLSFNFTSTLAPLDSITSDDITSFISIISGSFEEANQKQKPKILLKCKYYCLDEDGHGTLMNYITDFVDVIQSGIKKYVFKIETNSDIVKSKICYIQINGFGQDIEYAKKIIKD
jgi:hypothetical protein